MTLTNETELDLLKQKAKFADEKVQLQLQISEINQQCCTRIPNNRFRELQGDKVRLTRRIYNCEQWIGEIKGKLLALKITKRPPGNIDAKVELQEMINVAYDKWKLASTDAGKTITEQGMAALFVNDLIQIQKKLNHV